MGLTFEDALRELEENHQVPPASSHLLLLTRLVGRLPPSKPQYGPPRGYLAGQEDDRDITSPTCTFEQDSSDILLAVEQRSVGLAALKRLRRAYVLRQHPDRIRDATKLQRATEVLSRVNAAIDDLEQGQS